MSKIPTVILNNNVKIPIFGLGTWKSAPGVVGQVIKDAIDAGYRHFDCAHIYGNEAEIGAALKEVFNEGKVKREDVFITSKLWNSFHRPGAVEPALRTTLKNLELDYLDLYLIHWPTGFKEIEDNLWPLEDGKVIVSDVDYVDTWKAMEEVYKKGLTKSIGISNFNKEQIERVLKVATVVPQTNQVECHPYLNQKKLMQFCKEKNITITAYSPLGSADRPWAKPGDPELLDDPKIKAIGTKYGKTAAQVVLKYQVQRGNIVIPKSVNKKRMEENINIFDFELSNEDIVELDSFDCNGRICPLSDCSHHKYYPFNAEY